MDDQRRRELAGKIVTLVNTGYGYGAGEGEVRDIIAAELEKQTSDEAPESYRDKAVERLEERFRALRLSLATHSDSGRVFCLVEELGKLNLKLLRTQDAARSLNRAHVRTKRHAKRAHEAVRKLVDLLVAAGYDRKQLLDFTRDTENLGAPRPRQMYDALLS